MEKVSTHFVTSHILDIVFFRLNSLQFLQIPL